MAKFGLIGQSLQHSFSQKYFTDFFKREKLPHSYSNFEMENIEGLRELIKTEQLSGLNVTIPYKEDVIPLLDEIDPAAKDIGAVNVLKVYNGKLIGYNTDHIGFRKSLTRALRLSKGLDHVQQDPSRASGSDLKALILGTGGASKAIKYSLKQLGIDFLQASRSDSSSTINYSELTEELVSDHSLIINCTPLGTFPKIDEKPAIPYEGITADHILYDLVYNPAETAFLKEGKARDATILNGAEMLRVQAEESWKTWNK